MDFKIERIDEAKLWLQRAQSDLKMAKLAYENKLFPESVYHSQQTAEKSLKIVLILFGEDINEHKVATYFDDFVNLKYDYDLENVIGYSLELERHWISSKYPIKRRDGKVINPNDIYNKEKSQKLLKKAEYVLKHILDFLDKEFDLKF